MRAPPNHHHLDGHTAAHRPITHPDNPHITDLGTVAHRMTHTNQATTRLKTVLHLVVQSSIWPTL